MQGIPIFFYTIPMQIYLLKLPLSSDVFAKNLELLKCYLHPSDYGLLSAKTNSQMLSAMGKISVQYLYGRQASAQGSVYPLPFAYTKEGKPYLEGCSDFCFNISHTKEWVAVMLSEGRCGVDIESLGRNFSKVASRYLPHEERERLAEIAGESFEALMWSAKEALDKYGASEGLDFLQDMVVTDIDPTEQTLSAELYGLATPPVHYQFVDDHILCYVSSEN